MISSQALSRISYTCWRERCQNERYTPASARDRRLPPQTCGGPIVAEHVGMNMEPTDQISGHADARAMIEALRDGLFTECLARTIDTAMRSACCVNDTMGQ
jgi:hypothetical protein